MRVDSECPSWNIKKICFIGFLALWGFKFFFLVAPLKKFFFNVYLFLRETETECQWVRGRERERETQNRKQAPGSEPSVQSPARGSNSRAVRSWPEPKSDAQPTEPPRRPSASVFKLVWSWGHQLHPAQLLSIRHLLPVTQSAWPQKPPQISPLTSASPSLGPP